MARDSTEPGLQARPFTYAELVGSVRAHHVQTGLARAVVFSPSDDEIG